MSPPLLLGKSVTKGSFWGQSHALYFGTKTKSRGREEKLPARPRLGPGGTYSPVRSPQHQAGACAPRAQSPALRQGKTFTSPSVWKGRDGASGPVSPAPGRVASQWAGPPRRPLPQPHPAQPEGPACPHLLPRVTLPAGARRARGAHQGALFPRSSPSASDGTAGTPGQSPATPCLFCLDFGLI